jgi:hypothetical protein
LAVGSSVPHLRPPSPEPFTKRGTIPRYGSRTPPAIKDFIECRISYAPYRWPLLLLLGIQILTADPFGWRNHSSEFWDGSHPIPIGLVSDSVGHWKTVLLGGLAMALVTVSLFELFKLLIQYVLYYLSFRVQFDQFFGDDATSRSRNGIVYLQSDTIHGLLKDFLEETTPSIEITTRQRSYKARSWLNRWDAEGARHLREQFQSRRLDAPEFRPIDHGADLNIPANAPFAISMGLGFTDNTKQLTHDLPWLRIACAPDHGDCIYLKQELVPAALQKFCPHKKTKNDIDNEGFTRILPDNWDLNEWLKSPGTSRDFAIILRRTLRTPAGNRQVQFVLAGFTEIGTAAAGAYLANNWSRLWKRYVRGRLKEGTHGDFLAIIEGPSDPGAVADWGEDPDFPAITETTVKRLGRDYEWSVNPGIS